MLEKLLSFMKKTLEKPRTRYQEQLPDAASKEPGADAIDESELGTLVFKSHVSVLQDRQEMQVTDIEYTLKRVSVQSDAVS